MKSAGWSPALGEHAAGREHAEEQEETLREMHRRKKYISFHTDNSLA